MVRFLFLFRADEELAVYRIDTIMTLSGLKVEDIKKEP